MHDLLKTSSRVLLVPGLLTLALAPGSVLGDDTGFLGRIFRLGGNSSASPPGGSGRAAAPSDRSATLPYGPSGAAAGPVSRPAATLRPSGPGSSGAPFADGPSTPDVPGDLSTQPRVSPRPRTSSAVTSADPLLTRMALGRSNDGSQFGIFLQIFADGTVIDSDGVHKLGAADLRPIAELIQGGELTRVRGHCSSPSADFVEYVQVVVFERRMGRLQAHSLSYSGNPQGCDHAIRQLHAFLESVQAKLSRQTTAAVSVTTTHPGVDAHAMDSSTGLSAPSSTSLTARPGSIVTPGAGAGIRAISPLPDPGATSSSRPSIPLSPLEPR